jgi:transcriptional regulator with XRE-family HTH domain
MPKTTVKNMTELGRVLKAVRELSNYQQKEFAEAINVTPQYLVGLEGGAKNLFTTRLFRALRRLGITVTLSWDPKGNDRD